MSGAFELTKLRSNGPIAVTYVGTYLHADTHAIAVKKMVIIPAAAYAPARNADRGSNGLSGSL